MPDHLHGYITVGPFVVLRQVSSDHMKCRETPGGSPVAQRHMKLDRRVGADLSRPSPIYRLAMRGWHVTWVVLIEVLSRRLLYPFLSLLSSTNEAGLLRAVALNLGLCPNFLFSREPPAGLAKKHPKSLQPTWDTKQHTGGTIQNPSWNCFILLNRLHN